MLCHEGARWFATLLVGRTIDPNGNSLGVIVLIVESVVACVGFVLGAIMTCAAAPGWRSHDTFAPDEEYAIGRYYPVAVCVCFLVLVCLCCIGLEPGMDDAHVRDDDQIRHIR